MKAGEDVAQAYSPQGFYRFPQFSKAILYFKGGGQNTGVLFNYNVLSGNMQFISPKGDTLDMGNTAGLDSIVFEKNVFIYNNGFMEVAANTDSIKLVKKLLLKTQVEIYRSLWPAKFNRIDHQYENLFIRYWCL